MAEYIDRDALLEHLKKDPLFDLVERYGVSGVIESFPAADVRPVVLGEWLPIIEANEYGEPYQAVCYCSACNEVLQYEPNFCPNCGALMR